MGERAEVRSFDAIDYFRAAVMRFMETANAAMSAAEADIARTLSWLETDQLPYWKAMLRQTADELEQAKTAYRDKKLYKDYTGMRHSAIDELKHLRKVEAKRAEVERRDKATRRTLRELQRDMTLYHAGSQQLRTMVNAILPASVEELARVVEQLERYVHVAPEAPPPDLTAGQGGESPPYRLATPGSMAQPPDEPGQPASGSARAAPARSSRGEAAPQVAFELRLRTPRPGARAAAPRGPRVPSLPAVPEEALAALLPLVAGKGPGKYEAVTTTLADPAGGAYLERLDPSGPGDSGWHVGPAADAGTGDSCVTITVGRLAAESPDLARLLALPPGTLLLAREGRLAAAFDGHGRVLWSAQPPEGEPPAGK